MSTEFQNVDDFLNYKGSETTGGKRLKGWANDPGFLNWWMHTQQFPIAIWYHRLPELVVWSPKDAQDTKKKNIWGRQLACHEDDKILKKMYFRNDDGSREFPPKKCGLCRCVECVYQMVRRGQLQDTDLIFKWEGSDKPEENIALHAGGFANYWKRDKLSDAEKERLKNSGIYFSGKQGVWRENAQAKLNYIFVGVNQDDVAAGVQVAVQTKDVGEKVRATINKEIASNDGDAGNPFINPYCIQVLYKAEEKEFGKKYDALRMNRFKLTPEIERLIKGEKPSVKKYTDKFDQALVRSQLESHALVDLPWDRIFDVEAGPVEPPGPKTSAQVPADVKPSAPAAPPAPAAAAPAASSGGRRRVEPPKEEMGDPCDDCKAPMTKTQTKCTQCGAVYANDTPAPAAAAPAAPAAPAAEPSMPDLPGLYEQDSEVPF